MTPLEFGDAPALVDHADAVGAGHSDVWDAVAPAAMEYRAIPVVLDRHVADGARLAVDGEDPVQVTGLVAEGAGAGRRRGPSMKSMKSMISYLAYTPFVPHHESVFELEAKQMGVIKGVIVGA